jgi:hypothetical protein
MNSIDKIKNIITSVDKKLGAKSVDLTNVIQVLCNGYGTSTTSKTRYTPSNSNIESNGHLKNLLQCANRKTGQSDETMTQAIQRLCNGYNESEKLYSFGVLSDIHIQYVTGLDDFQRALTYLRTHVPFTCICGDLVSFASSENMAQYKEYITNYKGDMLIYECAGNHESYPSLGVGSDVDLTLWKNTTGKEPFYSFTYKDDVFLFLSLKSERPADLFADGGLTWLEQTLEANKNKRCFVFQHVQDPEDRSADPSDTYSKILGGTSGKDFLRIIKKYKNTIWFHGHTHVTLGVDIYPVATKLGYRSVHIPSLVSPRFYDKTTNALVDYYYDENNNKIWGSTLAQGYIVDVYENKIVLKGVDFANGSNKDQVALMSEEFYVIDTTLV